MTDDLLFADELTEGDRTIRITVDAEGSVIVTIESVNGPYSHHTMYGGFGLLMWLQSQAERAAFTIQRREAA